MYEYGLCFMYTIFGQLLFFDEQRKDLDTNYTVNSYRMYFKMFIRPYYCQTILYNILLNTIQVLQ